MLVVVHASFESILSFYNIFLDNVFANYVIYDVVSEQKIDQNYQDT